MSLAPCGVLSSDHGKAGNEWSGDRNKGEVSELAFYSFYYSRKCLNGHLFQPVTALMVNCP